MRPCPPASAALRAIRVAALAGLLAAPPAFQAAEPAAVAPKMIEGVAAAFARWPNLESDEPLRVEGVVIGTMPSGAFRLHDGQLGIYVTKSADGMKLNAGDRVAVTGVLRKGGFSPWMTLHTLTRLGRGEFPEARPVGYSVLASGAADNQWVQIEGVVRGVQVPESREFVMLDLGMPGGNLRVPVRYDATAPFDSLIDAEVRIRGVAAVNVNAQKHVVEPSFRVSAFSDITVLRPGEADAFAGPVVPVKRLMRVSLGTQHQHQHRVKTSGIVTRQLSENTFFVRDVDAGLKIETSSPQAVRPGDLVEAAGFPVIAEGMAVLQQAVIRKTGAAAPPAPTVPSGATLLDGTHNSDLVQVQARLIDWVVAGRNATLVLQSGDELYKGLLNVEPSATVELPGKNSLVNVTGICAVNELEDVWFYRPRSFVLLLGSISDIQLVQAPPWWTRERLRHALAITFGVLLAAGAWVWALRRQIGQKRAVIEQQARHAAALQERSRIARELHDTLEQGLTGLSLQMKAMETDLAGAPETARARLQFARQMLRQSRALARNAVRELRTETLPRSEGLLDGLRRIADSWNHSGALTVRLAVSGKSRGLPASIETHLLGIGTEAITNAVKHGRAAAIAVEVAFGGASVTLRISDNGSGFEPAHALDQSSGCFGIVGMRERAREIGGELQIQSQPGRGAEVVVTAPIPPDDAAASPQMSPSPASLAPRPSTA